VAWTGPNNQGDYITVVAAGATKWTNEPYFYTTAGTPGHLIAPTTPGAYELWYVDGASAAVSTRRPLTVTAFVGTVSGPATVAGGTAFSVAWSGPNATGDYVTIMAASATDWTGESYFYTTAASPGTLYAPLDAGAYELRYVAGQDGAAMVRAAITVTAVVASVSAPASADRGASISVTWTGPDGYVDYITIVPVGAAEGAYLSYAYTSAGSPATIVAPDTAGDYEIRYVYGSGSVTLASAPIQIK
jgi:Ca-activated chloride channel family protein